LALLAGAIWLVRETRRQGAQIPGLTLTLGLVIGQVVLGVLTLVLHMPLVIAAMHQLVGAAVFAGSVRVARQRDDVKV
jgi:heme A synthase